MKLLSVFFIFLLVLSFASAQLEIGRGDETERGIDLDSLAALVNTFLGLTDTPNSYSGEAGSCVAVNTGGTGLEFVNCTNSTLFGGFDNTNLAYLNNSPQTFTGASNIFVNVTSSDTIVGEFVYNTPAVSTGKTALQVTPSSCVGGNMFSFAHAGSADNSLILDCDGELSGGSTAWILGIDGGLDLGGNIGVLAFDYDGLAPQTIDKGGPFAGTNIDFPDSSGDLVVRQVSNAWAGTQSFYSAGVSIRVAEQIQHYGDSNTYFTFPTTDHMEWWLNGVEYMDFTETGGKQYAEVTVYDWTFDGGNIYIEGGADMEFRDNGTIIGGRQIFSGYDTTGGVTIGTTAEEIEIDTEIRKDNYYTHTSGSNVTLIAQGYYWLEFDIATVETNSGRSETECWLTAEGTEITGTKTFVYNRNTLDNGSGHTRRLYNATAGDTISLQCKARIETVTTVADATRLNIEYAE